MSLRRVLAWSGPILICAGLALALWTRAGTPGWDRDQKPTGIPTGPTFQIGSKTYTDRQFGVLASRLTTENPATMNVLCATLRSAKTHKAALNDFAALVADGDAPVIRDLVSAFFELPVTDPADSITSVGRMHAIRLLAYQCAGARTAKTV
jgi:hypothetical protein